MLYCCYDGQKDDYNMVSNDFHQPTKDIGADPSKLNYCKLLQATFLCLPL